MAGHALFICSPLPCYDALACRTGHTEFAIFEARRHLPGFITKVLKHTSQELWGKIRKLLPNDPLRFGDLQQAA